MAWRNPFRKKLRGDVIIVPRKEPYYPAKYVPREINMSTSVKFREEFLDYIHDISKDPKHDLIVVEMGHVEYIDASGVGVFIEALRILGIKKKLRF